jgi:hypothetical protein
MAGGNVTPDAHFSHAADRFFTVRPWTRWLLGDHDGVVSVPVWQDEKCPHCGGELRLVGLLLCLRPDDQKLVCRTLLWCASCDRVWSRWADRHDPLEPDVTMPEDIKRSLRGS